MPKSTSFATALFVATSALAFAADAPKLPDLSADVVMTPKGAPSQKGRFYASGGRIRNEFNAGGQTIVTVIDPGAKKSWALMPPPMGCMEQPLDSGSATPFDASAQASKEELLGSETIDGHPTKKYRVTTKVDGKDYSMLQWRATDLGNVAIQWTDEGGENRGALTNVKLGKQDAALFQVPGDCRSMADMMKGLPVPGTP